MALKSRAQVLQQETVTLYHHLCNSIDLCVKATVNKKWETRPEYLPYVKEAKRQNLACGVSVASANSAKVVYLTSSGVWEQMVRDGKKMCEFQSIS